MEQKKDTEELYEEYLRSEDKSKEIGAETFYKVIYKSAFMGPSANLNWVEIFVPEEAVHGAATGKIMDENNHIFKVIGPARMSFHGDIPLWYLKTVIYMVEGISHISEIGEYIRFIPEAC